MPPPTHIARLPFRTGLTKPNTTDKVQIPRQTRRQATANASARPLLRATQPQPSHSSNPLLKDSIRRKCRVFDFRTGAIPYHKGWDFQHAVADELKMDEQAPDALILLEHEPVYTLGTASKLDHVLFNAREVRRNESDEPKNENENRGEAIIVRTERGGEVTYHGPGQLVVYPILNLRRHKMDLHWYLRSLEDAVIHMLDCEYNIQAGRKEGLTGVWVGDEKICAMGLKVSKWITMHGLAINVHTDLQPFSRIVPCGIQSHGVSSIHRLLSREVCLKRARESFIESFDAIFGPYEFITSPLP